MKDHKVHRISSAISHFIASMLFTLKSVGGLSFSMFLTSMSITWFFLQFSALRPFAHSPYVTLASIPIGGLAHWLTSIYWRKLKCDFTQQQKKSSARSYPLTAEKLLDLLLPAETAEEAIEHINAQFEKRRFRYGLAHARRWYWWQGLRSVTEGAKYLVEVRLKISGK